MIKPKEKLNIFVYGSLRTNYFNFDKYLKGNVMNTRLGRVKGKLYHMNKKGYPALIDGDDFIYGEIMELSNYESILEEVDKMEGYNGDTNKENEYNRVVINVELLDSNKHEKCYVYKYNIDNDENFYENSIYIPNGDWTKR